MKVHEMIAELLKLPAGLELEVLADGEFYEVDFVGESGIVFVKAEGGAASDDGDN